jgi:hypothetical protein
MTPTPGPESDVTRAVRLRARQRRGSRRGLGWLIVVAIAILLAGTVWLLRTRVPESFAPSPGVTGEELAPLGAYELFFGDGQAAGVRREIRYLPRTGELEDDARAVIEALVEGSLQGGLSPWPRETTLEDLFVSTSGIAYVNFNGSLRQYAPPGDFIEWLLAASLTRSLCANFPALRGVRVLIDGQSTGMLIRILPLEWTLAPSMFVEAP